MSELKLTQHPEITELLSVLEQNGLHKEQDEVKSLAAYIDEMEGQLSAMNEELMQMHREISTIRDSSLKVRCEKLISGAEKQLRQAVTAIRTVKDNCLCMARNAMDTFKANGKAALRRAVFAMKIPSTLALLQDMLERQAASAQKKPSAWATFKRNCRRPEPIYSGRAARCSEGQNQKMPSMNKIKVCLARRRPLWDECVTAFQVLLPGRPSWWTG